MYEEIKANLSRLCERAQKLIAEEDKDVTYREIVVGKDYRGASIVSLGVQGVKIFTALAILVFLISYVMPYVMPYVNKIRKGKSEAGGVEK